MIDQPQGGLAPPSTGSLPVAPASTTTTRVRAGQLTPSWQIMLGVTWAAVFFAFAATWKVSEEIGIGTWWLGPRAEPQPLPVNLSPFLLAVCVTFAAIYNVRRVATISLGCSVLLALVAAGDISRSGGLAAIEFAIAAAVMLVSLGALTGTYRSAPPPTSNAALPTSPPPASFDPPARQPRA